MQTKFSKYRIFWVAVIVFVLGFVGLVGWHDFGAKSRHTEKESVGDFYTNITLIGPTQKEIGRWLVQHPRWAAVSPTIDGKTVVFDGTSERQDDTIYKLGELLSRELSCTALSVMNHDNSILFYQLFTKGVLIDKYCSSPNYFDGTPVPPSGGDADALVVAFRADPARRVRVQDILTYDCYAEKNEGQHRYVFEIERHNDLATALGLPAYAVGFGYKHLCNDELPTGLDADDLLAVEGNAKAVEE